MQPVVADKLESSTGNPGHDSGTLGVRGGRFVEPDGVDLEHIGSGDDEIGYGAEASRGGRGGRPVGVKIVGVNWRYLGWEVGG